MIFNFFKNNVLGVLFKVIPVIFLLIACHADAVIEIAPLSNEALEARYRAMLEELRCPKCQNQNLADSDSPIAADLREQVRVLLEEGKSDDEIVAYLVDRYGDFVRYRPAVQSNTLMLWFAPGVFFLLALCVVFLVVRSHQRSRPTIGQLNREERERLETLLSSNPDSGEKH